MALKLCGEFADWGITTHGDLKLYHGRVPGSGGRSGQWHRWLVPGHISAEDTAKLQFDAGYPGQGYGFYKFTHAVKKNGTKYTYWECSNNCD